MASGRNWFDSALVGSTGMSAALDAEDWRDLVGGYLDAASEAVTQMGDRVSVSTRRR